MLNRDSRLRVFHAVALHGNFTKAADMLCLTQQAVSFQVKSLEDEIGARLFARTSLGAELTAPGQALYAYSTKILALYADAEKAMSDYAESAVRKVSIGATGSIAQHCLPRIVEEFRRERPRVQLHVKIGNSQQVLEWLGKDAVDIGIVSAGPVVLGSFRVMPWFSDELVLIVPRSHRWATASEFVIEELQQEPFVIREPGSGSRKLIEDLLSDHGISIDTMNLVLEVQSTDAVKAAVEAGVGVAIVSTLSLRNDFRADMCAPIHLHGGRWERDFYIVTAHRNCYNAHTSEFLTLLQESPPTYRPSA